MDRRLRRFVAGDLWLLIAIVTFASISLAGIAGLEALAGAITIVGWFLLTPIFLFWGDEIAALLADSTRSESTREADPSALDELKRRYAAGEIDDEEFERRLERLVAVEDLPDDVVSSRSTDDGTATPHGESDREREREWK